MSAAPPEVRGPPGAASPVISLPTIKPDLGLNDATLFAVYCFIKNFIGASGTSAVAIDNKIEQAMPLCANFKKPLL
ncbi:unnamed protein product [Leptidea sinapis]|uniref:Uncharacterized protein n=1 Tax=Leptidea sinapis TaxID=189913 RepID=A0A5E4Q253_9NEOP|nr:unnamed protein product [Leptidea sinapis]